MANRYWMYDEPPHEGPAFALVNGEYVFEDEEDIARIDECEDGLLPDDELELIAQVLDR